MGLVSSWLRRWDSKNQIVMNALANIVHADRPGVVIISKPSDPASDVWKVKNVVSIDGARQKLPFGSTFYALEPGRHTLAFGIRGPLGRGARARVEIDVPTTGQVTVLYRPAMWPTGDATADVQM